MNELISLILALVLLTILISIVMRISYNEEEKIRVQHNIYVYDLFNDCISRSSGFPITK